MPPRPFPALRRTRDRPATRSDQRCPGLDGTGDELAARLLVTGSKICGASEEPPTASDGARRIDADGRALMPGMSDAHWHMIFAPNRMDTMLEAGTGLMYAHAVAEAESTLLRGCNHGARRRGPRSG